MKNVLIFLISVIATGSAAAQTITLSFEKNNNNVYNNNNNNNNNTTGNAIYSNTFQLRQGYDMDISIKGNGQVSFSERRVRNRNNIGYNRNNRAPMSDVEFNQMLQNVRNR